MSRDEEIRLADIAESLQLIRTYRDRATEFSDGREDQLLGDAVLLRLAVIGEAVKHLSEDTRAQEPDIDWAAWAGQRDLISHSYFRIEMTMIWDTVDTDVPKLDAAVD